MAPAWITWPLSARQTVTEGVAASSDSTSVSALLAAQWKNPGDILSILLLLGPDVVQRAIAQLTGRAITPVAFSFGWVAYGVGALLSSFGGADSPLL